MIIPLIILSSAFSYALGDKEICKTSDKECLLRKGNQLYKKLLEVDDQNIDPMYNEMYEGYYADLEFKFRNNTITGFKTCKVVDCDLDFTERFLNAKFFCEMFSFKAKYELFGQIFMETIEGEGDFSIDTKAYKFEFNSSFELVKNDDKTYAQIKHFLVKPTAAGEVVFNVTDLVHGQKEATMEFRKAAREHWKDVIKMFHNTIANTNFKNIVNTLNYVLMKTPLTDHIEF